MNKVVLVQCKKCDHLIPVSDVKKMVEEEYKCPQCGAGFEGNWILYEDMWE